MVGQGRIGELIAAKPQARRQLLEEAAGISGLHSRRHEAELRLRAAESNLERLDDVTSQLESQIESLKRQARQASRFKIAFGRYPCPRGDAACISAGCRPRRRKPRRDSALNQATVVVAEKAQAQMEAAKAQGIASLEAAGTARGRGASRRRAAAPADRPDAAGGGCKPHPAPPRRAARAAWRSLPKTSAARSGWSPTMPQSSRDSMPKRPISLKSWPIPAATPRKRGGFEEAAAKLADSERIFTAVTAERAEAAAGRNQLERAIRDLADRRMRLERQMDEANRELSAIGEKIATLPDPDEKRAVVEAGEIAVAEAGGGDPGRRTGARARPGRPRRRRAAVDQARSRLNALETEARTIPPHARGRCRG